MNVSVDSTPSVARIRLTMSRSWSSSSHTVSTRRSTEPGGDHHVVDLVELGERIRDRAGVPPRAHADHGLPGEADLQRVGDGHDLHHARVEQPLHTLTDGRLGEPDGGGDPRIGPPAVLLQLLDDRARDVVEDQPAPRIATRDRPPSTGSVVEWPRPRGIVASGTVAGAVFGRPTGLPATPRRAWTASGRGTAGPWRTECRGRPAASGPCSASGRAPSSWGWPRWRCPTSTAPPPPSSPPCSRSCWSPRSSSSSPSPARHARDARASVPLAGAVLVVAVLLLLSTDAALRWLWILIAAGRGRLDGVGGVADPAFGGLSGTRDCGHGPAPRAVRAHRRRLRGDRADDRPVGPRPPARRAARRAARPRGRAGRRHRGRAGRAAGLRHPRPRPGRPGARAGLRPPARPADRAGGGRPHRRRRPAADAADRLAHARAHRRRRPAAGDAAPHPAPAGPQESRQEDGRVLHRGRRLPPGARLAVRRGQLQLPRPGDGVDQPPAASSSRASR